jgi:hypothetical protein
LIPTARKDEAISISAVWVMKCGLYAISGYIPSEKATQSSEVLSGKFRDFNGFKKTELKTVDEIQLP